MIFRFACFAVSLVSVCFACIGVKQAIQTDTNDTYLQKAGSSFLIDEPAFQGKATFSEGCLIMRGVL